MHILEGTAELTEIKRDRISGASRAEARVACKKDKKRARTVSRGVSSLLVLVWTPKLIINPYIME